MLKTLISKSIVGYCTANRRALRSDLTKQMLRSMSKRINVAPLVIPIVPNGFVELDLNDPTALQLLQDPSHDIQLWDALSEAAGSREVFWDIGAGTGLTTFRALWDPLVAEVHAFEERSNSFQGLKRSATHNPGNLYLHPFTPNLANSIDSVIEKKLAKVPTLLKVSVLEKESAVFLSADRLFAEAPPKLVVFEARADAAGVMRDRELRLFFERHQMSSRRISSEKFQGTGSEIYIASSAALADQIITTAEVALEKLSGG